jgi:hypothetical protein
MKDVLGLATLARGALCLVVFVATVKPDAISAVPASARLPSGLGLLPPSLPRSP